MAKRLHQVITGPLLGEQQNRLLAKVLPFSLACPFDQTNPQDCPLFRLRKMRPIARSRWLRALPEHDLSYLAAYHQVCLTIRVKSGLGEQPLAG